MCRKTKEHRNKGLSRISDYWGCIVSVGDFRGGISVWGDSMGCCIDGKGITRVV